MVDSKSIYRRGDLVSASMQDYAKAVYALELKTGKAVSTKALANRLGVTPGSASGMLRKLAEQGLVEHVPYHGVHLTEEGRSVALAVIRNHRLIELFLFESLGMSWDQVDREAEVLEHFLSSELEEVISEYLGDPQIDPHGDPIPSATHEIDEGNTLPLADLTVGSRGTFVRVSDADPAKLRYLAARGIQLGDHLTVVDRQPFGGPLQVKFGETEHPIGGELAADMRIEIGEPKNHNGKRLTTSKRTDSRAKKGSP